MKAKTRQLGDLRTIAYHEAGHAVALWANHLRFTCVSIDPAKESLGRVSATLKLGDEAIDAMAPRTRDKMERWIVSLLAAREAQRVFSRSGRYSHEDARVDRHHALELASRMVPPSQLPPLFQLAVPASKGFHRGSTQSEGYRGIGFSAP